MSDPIREIAGLRCTDVLEHLRAYIDGDLDSATRARVDEHLAGCTWCSQFGGRYAELVGDLGALDAQAEEDETFAANVLDRVDLEPAE